MKYYQMNGCWNAFAILDGRGARLNMNAPAIARIAKAADFAKSHDGLMDDIGENDPSDMALDFGKCLSADTAELLRLAVEKRQLAARGFYKVTCMAQTIANLGQSKQMEREEGVEALAYRMMPLLA